ncbi:unnamed protein product [Miscanthus lutarioriparius]|uniref:SAM domain-containing protein n=1 Tax=Miscanthus lutarioriparius TaxID=422564 RepID=A0A811NB65_9POAL|nr:unnamed protein product [Miscanthus lutarioriparius]
MPASGKLSAKPSPSPTVAPASRPKFTAVTLLGDSDDDDDFQPPRPRPLKPCNGAAALRLRKKLKASSSSGSSGKENSSAAGGAVTAVGSASTAAKDAETLAAGSRVSGGVPKPKKRKTGEICGLSRYGSDRAKLSCKPKIGLDRYGYGKGSSSSLPNSIESRVLALGAVCDLGVGRCEEAQVAGSQNCTSVLQEGHATPELAGSECGPPKTEKKLGSSGAVEGHYNSRLIEPALESDANREFLSAGSYDSEGLDSGILGSLTDKQDTKKANGVASECGFGLQNGSYHLDSLQSELLMSNIKYDSRVCASNEIQEPGLGACNLISQERKVAAGHSACATPENVTMENKSSEPEACKGQCRSNSSESKLLESHMIHDFEVDGCDDFEIGTQLSELINLCMKDSIEGQSNFSASPMEQNTLDSKRLSSDYEVKCPLCGSDISDLSEELRQLHTNNCLDEPAKESSPNHKKEPCAGQNVEIGHVVEWLRNLGLSKYEEVFIREEVDWETLQWLTEEDLLGIGITSLGPRKKIIHALGELRKKHDDPSVVEDVLNSENTKKTKVPMNGNKLITEYFQCSSFDQRQRRACKVNKPSNLDEKKISSAKIPTRRSAGKGKVKDTPLWCCIPGTPFRVDAFRYLRGDCSHWFLTHFHVDHYQGLTRSFCHGKIYCSSITASLVHHKIGIPWDRLHVLTLNEKHTIAGVSLTCFDANHCPGSIIILFEPPNGKAVLHTGDFRFSSEMANNPVLQSSHIHTLILDTTYCNPRYDFPSQEIVIQFVIEAIQAEAFNPKTLFLIGSYTIGKERLFMEVARLLQKKIYVGAAKLQILKHLELPQDIMHWFTANEAESHIHVVPMWTLASFKRMKYLSNQYAGRFDLIVAFCPTGWAFGKGRKKTPGKRWQQGSIIRYEVPYSEHSSFTELQQFVKFISPEHIIPSVNNDGPESADAMLAQLLND